MDETQLRLADHDPGRWARALSRSPISRSAISPPARSPIMRRWRAFRQAEGTGETIKFMEALGIANALRPGGGEQGAVRWSSSSPTSISPSTFPAPPSPSPASFGMLAGILAKRRKLAPRTPDRNHRDRRRSPIWKPPARRSLRCARWAIASGWTISAPAPPRSTICMPSRWTS